jgi:hypothetical protein
MMTVDVMGKLTAAPVSNLFAERPFAKPPENRPRKGEAMGDIHSNSKLDIIAV